MSVMLNEIPIRSALVRKVLQFCCKVDKGRMTQGSLYSKYNWRRWNHWFVLTVSWACAGLMSISPVLASCLKQGWPSEKGGMDWTFDTPGSWDEHPRLVRNPDPLTSHRILDHFWENYGYLIRAYIMQLITGVLASLRLSSATCWPAFDEGGGSAVGGSSDLTKHYSLVEGGWYQESAVTKPQAMHHSKPATLHKAALCCTKYPQQGGIRFSQWLDPQSQTHISLILGNWPGSRYKHVKVCSVTPSAWEPASLRSDIKSQGQSLLPGL